VTRTAPCLIISAPVRDLPSGTVTFLFTDVEGSTRLLHELGAEAYAAALGEHRRVLREAFAAHAGVEVDTQGDAFFVAFPTAPGALAAAAAIVSGLEPGPIRVRIGVHTGTPLLAEEGYVGVDVHRAARIAAAGHGGQVLVSSSTRELIEDDRLRDLGEHRFKDLAAPERVWQLGETEFPPVKSLYRTNLPVPATLFLGRQAELAAVVQLLVGEARLVVLTGPGGTGKTRLALQAAAGAAEHFPDGITWVPLAPLRDPALLLPALAQALELGDDPDREAAGTLSAALAGKRRLLLLDNIEHLLPGVAGEIARLRGIDGPTLLMTSRERLQLAGEHVYAVPPLEHDDGVALFTARARALSPSFRPTGDVEELCERLDRLPLALELAAARTVLFTPEQLLERLGQRLDLLRGGRDADPRQQTLRATIAWSHDQLTADEQRLFARIAVFAGGCTYEAAEDVCDADPDTLQSLLDKSLLQRRDTPMGPRYWMLETIREYALERLEDGVSGGDEERANHAGYFAELAEQAGRYESGGGDILAGEESNLRVALDWARRHDRNDLVLRILSGARQLWLRGSQAELQRDLARVLPLAGGDERLCAEAYGLLAHVSYRRGEYDVARSAGTEELTLATASGDARLVARALNDLANVDAAEGRFESARARFEQAGVILRQGGLGRLSLVNTVNLADLLLMSGELEDAVSVCRETLESAEIEDVTVRTTFQSNLATGLALVGRHGEAIASARAALLSASEAGDRYMLANILAVVALIAVGSEDRSSAARLLGASDALLDEVGGALEPTEEIVHRAVSAAIGAVGSPLDLKSLDDVPTEAVRLLDEWSRRGGSFPP